MILIANGQVDEDQFLDRLRRDRSKCQTQGQVDELRRSVSALVQTLSTAGQLKASVILEVE